MNSPTPDSEPARDFRPVLDRLGEARLHRKPGDNDGYRQLRADAVGLIREFPEVGEAVIEFQFRNQKASEEIQLEAIWLLYELGADPNQRGRATELLGLAEQSKLPSVRTAARRAVNGLSRRRLADGQRRGEQPATAETG